MSSINRFRPYLQYLPILLGLAFWVSLQPLYSEELSTERELLKTAGFNPANTQSLIPLFKGRSSSIPAKASIEKLIAQLINGNPEEKLAAKKDLICMGDYVISTLKKALGEILDPASEKNLKECIELLEGKGSETLISSALKVIASEGKAESSEVLFAYLPFAAEEILRNECESTLRGLFTTSGTVFEQTLTDTNPYKRAVAAEILVRKGNPKQISMAKSLLNDTSSLVRTRLVLAFLEQKDRVAMPTALKLLASDSKDTSSLIETALATLAGELAIQGPKNDDSISRSINQAAWAGWWKSINEQDLLTLLRESTAPIAMITEADKVFKDNNIELIKKYINSKSFKSNPALQAFLLNRAAFDMNIAKLIEPDSNAIKLLLQSNQVTPALIRLITLARPANAIEIILAYIPSCNDDNIQDLLGECLGLYLNDQNTPPPALIAASTSSIEEIRTFAGRVLAQSPNEIAQKTCTTLLSDSSVRVRFEVARESIKNQNKSAIPTLIELMTKVPAEKAEAIDQTLRAIAKEKSPESKNDSKADAAAWNTWWQKEGTQLVLTPGLKNHEALKNFLVVESFNQEKKSGRVFLVTPSGKTLWEIANLSNPTDALLLPNNKILITEQGANRITERDTKGNISWEKSVTNPFHSQRLLNGNIFIASRNKIVEVGRNGNEIFSFSYPNETILAACKTRTNEYALLSYNGVFLKLDSKGNEVSKSRIPFPTNFGINGGAITQNDRVLVSIPTLNKIMEFNFSGQSTWESTITMPGIPTKLPNGNVVAPSLNGSKIVEIQMDGKIIYESAPNSYRSIKVGKAP
jgi:HEAT repeat protein